jgi:hypothetical protein
VYPRSLFWRLQIGGFLALTVVILCLFVAVSHDVWFSLKVLAIREPLAFALTLGLWRVYRRWPAGKGVMPALAWRAGALSIVAAALDNAVAIPLLEALDLNNILPTPNTAWAGSFLLRCMLYLPWSALYLGLREAIFAAENELRVARIEAAARQADLNLLRAQMNTHFLFKQ